MAAYIDILSTFAMAQEQPPGGSGEEADSEAREQTIYTPTDAKHAKISRVWSGCLLIR